MDTNKRGGEDVLGSQERDLVEYIQAHPDALPQVIASYFQVSDRTIRTYVHRANDALEGAAYIVKQRGGGYQVVVEDADRFAAFMQMDDGISKRSIPSTPEERVDYLLSDLLSRSSWITIDDLASILFVSRNAISNDLKRVEEKLGRFGLTLERRPHYGIRVAGPEMSRRLCLANLTLDQLLDSSSSNNRAMLDVVARCVNDAINAESFQINSAAYQNLVVHIAVAVARIKEGCLVPMEPEQLDQLRSTRCYEMAEKIATAVEHELAIDLPDEEIGYISIHLAGKRSLYETPSGDDTGLVISDEVWGVVSEMLEVVWSAYHFDLRNDLELRMNLARHIVPLSVRLKYSMSIENPLLSDIKKRFPLAYAMALDSSAVLSKHYGSTLSEDEMGYIALAFALAIERQKTEMPRKNILVVCASGQGSARLLEWRYRQEFGALVGTIQTCDVSHIDKVDFTSIDYVFTTVPIDRKLPVPVRQVEFFLGDSDVRTVRTILTDSASDALGRYFDPDLFVPHIQAMDKSEVIDVLCNQVHIHRQVPANFRALVDQRERAAQTSFGNMVAMPHPAEAVTDDTFVCVGLLDRPVEWNSQPVRAVFLISISKSKNKDLDSFYRGMVGLLTSKEAIQELVDHQDWETLLVLLQEYGSPTERE